MDWGLFGQHDDHCEGCERCGWRDPLDNHARKHARTPSWREVDRSIVRARRARPDARAVVAPEAVRQFAALRAERLAGRDRFPVRWGALWGADVRRYGVGEGQAALALGVAA